MIYIFMQMICAYLNTKRDFYLSVYTILIRM